MKHPVFFGGVAVAALNCASIAIAQDAGEGETSRGCDKRRECIVIADRLRKDILVSANRANAVEFTEHYTGSATIITAEQLEERQTRDIADVLRDVPGVAVSSVAGQTQIRLRGTEANQVLVLIDGIEVSDPGSGEFDLGTLQAEIGSRLEVLRGAQSALYGSDALGGVVAYQSGEFSGLGGRIEAGTSDTINAAARWGVDEDALSASLAATLVSTNGQPNARGGMRDIGRDSYTVSGKLRKSLGEGFALRAVGRYARTEGEFNDQDFAFGSPSFGLVVDSPGVGYANKALYGLVGARLETAGGWTHDLSLQFADIHRTTRDASARTSDTKADRLKASYVSSYEFADRRHSLTFAADYEREGFNNIATFDQRRTVENAGLVGDYHYRGSRVDFSAALRHDFNDRFEDATTYRVGAGYWLSDFTRVHLAAGSGIKNPSFFELFGFFDGRFLGNPGLKPEKSHSWEAGLEQAFFDSKLHLSLTYFSARLSREIITTFPPPSFIQTPTNAATKSRQRGVEAALSAQISPQWRLQAAYSYLDAKQNGVREIRRPKHIASAALNWTERRGKASATLVVRYNGEAFDSDFTSGIFPAPLAILGCYTLVNLNARLRLAEGLKLSGRVENLLNERYEQVFSFVSPGRKALIGIEARF